MKILHIAKFKNNPCSGVSVAVPKYILSQQDKVDVALVNIQNYYVEGILNQYQYTDEFSIESILTSFCKPDIVVFHEVYYLQFLPIATELVNLNIPYIIIPHGCLTKNAQRRKYIKKKLGNALLFGKFVSNSYAIQYLSEDEMKNSIYRKKCIVIPNGIEMSMQKKDYTQRHGEEIKFVYVGRIDIYHKGLDLLLNAISSVKNNLLLNNAKFYLYGPAEKKDRLILKKMIKKLDLEDIVNLGGVVVGKEKKEIILDSDFFIQTSRFEGMPMGVLEVLSYGIPCLLTKGTCIGECVAKANAGFCCDTTTENIADMISKALSQLGKLEEYSQNAISFIRQEFELNSVATKTIDVYAQFLKGE